MKYDANIIKKSIFNGTSDYYSISQANATHLNFGTSDFAIEIWFRTTESNSRPMFSKSAGGSERYHFYMNGGKIFFFVRDPTGVIINFTGAAGTWNDGKLHHAILFADRANGCTLYVDGSKDGSTTAFSNARSLNVGSMAGIAYDLTLGYWAGEITLLRVYNFGIGGAPSSANGAIIALHQAGAIGNIHSLTKPYIIQSFDARNPTSSDIGQDWTENGSIEEAVL